MHLVTKREGQSADILSLFYSIPPHDHTKSILAKTNEILCSDLLYCTIVLISSPQKILQAGSLLRFEVQLEGNFDFGQIPYSIVYDHTKWLLSGSCNGFSKVKLKFAVLIFSNALLRNVGILIWFP